TTGKAGWNDMPIVDVDRLTTSQSRGHIHSIGRRESLSLDGELRRERDELIASLKRVIEFRPDDLITQRRNRRIFGKRADGQDREDEKSERKPHRYNRSAQKAGQGELGVKMWLPARLRKSFQRLIDARHTGGHRPPFHPIAHVAAESEHQVMRVRVLDRGPI